MTPRHPYVGLPSHQMWSRAVTWAPPGGLDPLVRPRFRIGHDDRIATMGSCFAQHVSRHLQRSGLRYFVAEEAPADMDADDAHRRQYGTFSARYGNVYTVTQALQLFRRAYGELVPVEDIWPRDDVLVDPFRPLVEPDGFVDRAALEADRDRHLAATRSVFEDSAVLVLTMGLTEAWRSRADGCVFPTAPGVNGGRFDPERHEFVNFGIDEVRADLVSFCEAVRVVNPAVRILLTVSPVPLIATYEDRHVLVSTTASKAVLRVAADEAVRRLDFVDYFPSYEIISAASATRTYYEPDLREVEELGVAHVMRCFTRHLVDGVEWQVAPHEPSDMWSSKAPPEAALVCEEETIEAAILASSGPGSPNGDGPPGRLTGTP